MRAFVRAAAAGCDEAWVGCSGNFTSERTLFGLVPQIHSNDVTLWSCLLGSYLSGQEFRMELKPSEQQYWVDIRIRRSGRSAGFREDAFAMEVGHDNYRWMPALGNANLGTGSSAIRIQDPAAAVELLDLVTTLHGKKRRVIFYCACERLVGCHRSTVRDLLLKAAPAGSLRVVEWPDESPLWDLVSGSG